MGTVNFNGMTFSGNSIAIVDNKVFVDGKEVSSLNNGTSVEIVINGDVESVKTNGPVKVYGNAGNIDAGGSVTVSGNAKNIDCGGSASVGGSVEGSIDAGGSVICRR